MILRTEHYGKLWMRWASPKNYSIILKKLLVTLFIMYAYHRIMGWRLVVWYFHYLEAP